jgi:DNA repair exonuclease SbcCD ATPase subunit
METTMLSNDSSSETPDNHVIEVANHESTSNFQFSTDIDFAATISVVITLLVAAIYQYFKYSNRDSKIYKAETDFYSQLSKEHDRLIERVKSLEKSREECQDETLEFKTRLQEVLDFEHENAKLRYKLDEKDELLLKRNVQINQLVSEIREKDSQILELTKRVSQLEKAISQMNNT